MHAEYAWIQVRALLACVTFLCGLGAKDEEQEPEIKADRAKNGASKRAGRGWGRKEGFLPSPSPPPPSLYLAVKVSFSVTPKEI